MRRALARFLVPILIGHSGAMRRRRRLELLRKLTGGSHQVRYFHQVDDPYSALTAHLLPKLEQAHSIQLLTHLCPPPSEGAAPEAERLRDWSRKDGAVLAKQLGLQQVRFDRQPSDADVQRAQRILLAAAPTKDRLAALAQVSAALWGWEGAASLDDLEARWGAAEPQDLEAELQKSEALRERLGHYLGSTLHYAGEWYWSPSRLHYLQERLTELGAVREGGGQQLMPVRDEWPGQGSGAEGATIELFLSLRSPYSYLACERVFDLARSYGAKVEIRYILPMVMRNLPVPRAKGIYIMKDCVREAVRRGLEFGKVADPVGRPVERGMGILAHACKTGKGEEYLRSFMRGVWSENIDAGTDAGMQKIVARAGLDWDEVRPLMEDDSWREQAEANRQELFDLGFWGAPSFRLGNLSMWGQDRMWQLSEALEDMAKGGAKPAAKAAAPAAEKPVAEAKPAEKPAAGAKAPASEPAEKPAAKAKPAEKAKTEEKPAAKTEAKAAAAKPAAKKTPAKKPAAKKPPAKKTGK